MGTTELFFLTTLSEFFWAVGIGLFLLGITNKKGKVGLAIFGLIIIVAISFLKGWLRLIIPIPS